MAENRKTTSRPKARPANGLAELAPPAGPPHPVLRLKNPGGAPKGNRNAFKTGRYTREMKDLRAQTRLLCARIDAAVAEAGPLITRR